MSCEDHKLSSLVLIQGTGSGKSTAPLIVGVVACGITIMLENNLSLCVDQTSKFYAANQENGPVQALQVDSIKTETKIPSLKDFYWNSLPTQTHLFSSLHLLKNYCYLHEIMMSFNSSGRIFYGCSVLMKFINLQRLFHLLDLIYVL